MSWDIVRLGDICEINPSTKGNFASYDANMPVSFLPMEAVGAGTGVMRPIVREFSEVRKGYTYFEDGDILFAKITPCMQNGKHAVARSLTNGIGFGSTEFHVLRPKIGTISEWIYYFISQKEFLQTAENFFQGTVGQQRLPDLFLKDAIIPFPPLPEQRRIAAEIERQLAIVEKAKRAATEQLAAARALKAAYLRGIFANIEGEQIKLGDVCVFEGGSQPPKSTFKYSPQKGFIRLIQIQDYRRDDMAVYIPAGLARRYCKNDDVMIGRYGPPVFQILRGLEGAYNVALMKAYPRDSNKLDNGFLYYLLQYEHIQSSVIEQSQRSAGQTGVDKDFLEKFDIVLPDIDSQRRITSVIESRGATTAKIISYVQAQLETINALPSAILRQAFSGKM